MVSASASAKFAGRFWLPPYDCHEYPNHNADVRNVVQKLALSVLALGVAAGCGSGHNVDGRRPLLVWGLANDDKGFRALADEFEREHLNVTVRILNMGAGAMNPQKLMTSIVGRVPPDVIYQDRFTVSDWASRGAFRPLDDLIERDRKRDPLCPTADKFYPAAWEEAGFEGRCYGIPYRVDARALFWNKKVFREAAQDLIAAGLDPSRPPRTWTELLAYGKALTKFNPDGTLARIGFAPNYGNSWLYLYAFMTNSRFLANRGRKCNLNSPEVADALAFMKRGYDQIGGYESAESFATGSLGKEQDGFISGRFAMKIDGDWILNDLVKFGNDIDFGVAPAPVPDDRFNRVGAYSQEKDRYVTWSGGMCFSIPTGARNVEDGWEFVKLATSPKGWMIEARERAATAKMEGKAFISLQPASIEASREVFHAFPPADPRFRNAVDVMRGLMPFAKMRPPTFAGQLLWDEQVRAMAEACSGRLSVSAALERGQERVQHELDSVFNQEKLASIEWLLPGLGAALLAVLVGLGLLWIRQFVKLKKLGRSEAVAGALLISPWLFGFLTLTLGPLAASLIFSLTQYNVLSPARWNGIANYALLFTSDGHNVGKAFYNVFWLAGFGVPLGIGTGLGIAMLLNLTVKGMNAFRTAFYLPSLVPAVASAVIWGWILSPSPTSGLLNAGWSQTIGQWFHLAPPGWFNSEAWAKPALVVMGLWGAGSGMILWLAGLKGISKTLYEAARLDGANTRQQFWNVTFPQLSPVIFFNVTMGFIGALQEFDRPYVLTAGGGFGPGDSLLTPVYYLFQNGFGYFRMGYASALAWTIFAVILLITGIQFAIGRLWVYYEGAL